jgi:AcrR family transcriptional regulator
MPNAFMVRAKPGEEEEQERKRRIILTTAANLFADRGFHEVRIDDIAKALDVSKPTIYYYVESKEDILYQIMSIELHDIERKLRQGMPQDGPAIAQLKFFLEIYTAHALSDFGICLSLVSDRSLGPQSRRKVRRMLKRVENNMTAIVERGARDGTIVVRDKRLFVLALFGAINWMPRWFSRDGRLTPSQLSQGIFDIFCNHMVGSARGKAQ